MRKNLRYAASVIVGGALASRIFYGSYSLSNIVNVAQAALGFLLVLYGIVAWLASDRPVSVTPVEAEENPAQLTRTIADKCYFFYLKFLLLAPGAAAVVLAIASALMGCDFSGATGEFRNCGFSGELLGYAALYSGLLCAAMASLLIPTTIIYLVVAPHFKNAA